MIKKLKIFTFLLIICLINVSCGSVKKAFDPERKNSSEEFLIEKKSPLSMPPNMEDLPVPQNKNFNEKEESNDVEILLNQIEDSSQNNNETMDSDTEKSIIEKIKKN